MLGSSPPWIPGLGLLTWRPADASVGTTTTTSDEGDGVSDAPEYKFVTYETLDDGTIARIMLDRADAKNAQNRGMLVELHAAFLRAEADDTVRVVILGGNGPMFSAGHDVGSKVQRAEYTPGPDQHPSFTVNGGTRQGAESLMLQEWHHYFE